MSDVLVVGCGLLGTSVGLALRDSALGDVTLTDLDAAHVATASRRGAGRPWDGREHASVVLVAVPPTKTARALTEVQRMDVARTYTHVSSAQSHVQAEIEALSSDPSRVVGGHPLAGREVSGPEAAAGDLFVGRPWAICPSAASAPDAVAAVRELAGACAAVPVDVDAETHDRAVALLSHLPQVTASALAGQLLTAGDRLPVVLAGSGLADTTRIAASDAALWTDILSANAAYVAPLVAGLAASLQDVAASLAGLAAGESGGAATVRAFLERGSAGRAAVPVKRGELAGAFDRVRVVLADRPGELARLLQAAGEAAVNVEDVRVEHVPGRPTGVVDLLVDGAERDRLKALLETTGWQLV